MTRHELINESLSTNEMPSGMIARAFDLFATEIIARIRTIAPNDGMNFRDYRALCEREVQALADEGKRPPPAPKPKRVFGNAGKLKRRVPDDNDFGESNDD